MTIAADFRSTLVAWLQAAMGPGLPEEVAAVSFNLTSGVEEAFAIELIGAGCFMPEDQDWACDEVWQPATRELDIPTSFSTAEWEQCLARVRALLSDLSEEGVLDPLKSTAAIGLGFVDGDLELLWSAEAASRGN